jgi:hypothetical protein
MSRLLSSGSVVEAARGAGTGLSPRRESPIVPHGRPHLGVLRHYAAKPPVHAEVTPLAIQETPGNAANDDEGPSPGVPRHDHDLDLAPLEAALGAEAPRRRRRSSRPPEEPTGAVVRPRRPRRTTTPERRLVLFVAVVAGLLCAGAPVQPTGVGVTDVLLLFGFAMVTTLAAARARRATWIVLATGAVLLSRSGPWFIVALLAMALALAATVLPRRRLTGALIAALALPALLRGEEFAFTGASAIGVWIAVLPVLISGYRIASGRSRERMHRIATGVALVVMIGIVVFAVVVWWSSHALSTGSASAKDGLADLRAGRGSDAAFKLSDAADSLDTAHTLLGGWWTFPAHLVPFVSQQLEGLAVASGQGHDIAVAGASFAAKANYHELTFSHGQIDLLAVQQLDQPLHQINAALAHARGRIDGVRSPWLVGPVRGALDTFSREIDDTTPQAQVAQQAVAVAPAMLGAHGTRHYFVIFTTESESRGLGGFMGSWAELTATNGKLSLTKTGRVNELNDAGDRRARVVTEPPEYVARYGAFQVGRYFQDVTLSPDLPDVAQVVRQVFSGRYPYMGRDPIDGVLAIDPAGLAALLQLTGPIEVPGAPVPLTAGNAEDFLLTRQYTLYPDEAARVDFLGEASRRTFEALTAGNIPGPDRITSVLAPAVAARHVMFTAFRADEQALFTRLGASGAFPRARPGEDFFAVVGQNHSNNKTDIWMQRHITYGASYDPASGHVDATATVTLHNGSPTTGQPAGVIGSNGRHLALGTNLTYLSFYSPLELGHWTLSGVAPLPFSGEETQLEFGYHVYSMYISIPSGSTATLTLHLSGTLASSVVYRLRWQVQQMVNDDAVDVTLRPAHGWSVSSAQGLYPLSGGDAASTEQLSAVSTRATVNLERS